MTNEPTEKQLLQARHRLEEAQMRNRVRERKARTRKLIQKGAILERTMPETGTMDLAGLQAYLSSLQSKQIDQQE